jgi:ABC-type glycerol-3-phosphate transport system substrate-binding protein
VAVPTGGHFVSENHLARDAVARVLPAVNRAAGGRFTLDLLEVAQPLPYQRQVLALAPLLASGAGPELLAFAGWGEPGGPQEEFAAVASIGLLRPLDAHLRGDRTLALGDFHPAALDSCRHRGELLAVPLVGAPVQLWYDAGRFAEAGEAPPDASWDWARALEAARRLTDRAADDEAAHRFGLSPGWRGATLLGLLWQNGGDAVSADKRRALLDEPAAAEAIAHLAGFYAPDAVYPLPLRSLAVRPDGLVMNGRWSVAMAYECAAAGYAKPKPAGSVLEVAPAPRRRPGAPRATALGVQATLSVGARARDPGLAAAALALLAEHVTTAVVPAPRRRRPAELLAAEPNLTPAAAAALADALGDARMLLLDDAQRTLEAHQALSGLASALQERRVAPAAAAAANRRLQEVLSRP